MRLVDADKLFPDVMKVDGSMAISQGQLAYAHTVEAIPKADYETRLKADMVAMLTDISLEADELSPDYDNDTYAAGIYDYDNLIQQKIDKLKEVEDDKRI